MSIIKKNIKIIKKYFFLYSFILIILFLVGFIIYQYYSNKDEYINTKQNKELAKLGFINKKLAYFQMDNLNRYLSYKKNNPKLSNEEVIIRVNIGIDNEYYTNIKKASFLNSNLVLVNKYRYLTDDYIPNNLEDISLDYARSGMKLVNNAKDAFEKMAIDAKKNNLTIIAMSSYRSYKYQEKLYNNYVKSDGIKVADTYSARPGFSEHQTGLAVDVYNGKDNYENFDKTKEYDWMKNNAYRFGFILRFPKGKENLTGYGYESWHYRYVGEEAASYIHNKNITFEEYYVQFVEK